MPATDKSRSPFIGAWWKYTEYELTGGCVRPAAGAALRLYDPWHEFEKAKLRRSRSNAVKTSWEQFVNISNAAEALAWCNAHGLPGLLPHRAEEIVPYPRWEFSGTNLPGTEFEQITEEAVVHSYRPVSGAWRDMPGAVLGANIGAEKIGRPFRPSRRGGATVEPYALIRDLERCCTRKTPVADAVGKFFPDVPEKDRATFAYPVPLTQKFWASYAEPVDEILAVANLLKDTASALGPSGHGRGRPAAEEVMDSFLVPVRARFSSRVRGRAGGHLRWGWGSMLAAMAVMLCEELGGEGRVLICGRPGCNRVFVSKYYQTHYCSTKCNNRVKVNRWRKKNPEAEKRYRELKRKRQRGQSAKAAS